MHTHPIEERAVTCAGPLTGLDAASAIDALVDHVADRLVAAISQRLDGRLDEDWLDSREAADGATADGRSILVVVAADDPEFVITTFLLS
jgi:hypothetical protein